MLDYSNEVSILRYVKHALLYMKGDNVRTEIKALRKERNMSQADLADALGVSRQTIISIENERYIASLPLAYRIAHYFGKTIEEVFDLADEDI